MLGQKSIEAHLEWAQITRHEVIVASPEKAWLHQPKSGTLFGWPMTGPGSLTTTTHLLDGAARMGWASVPEGPPSPFTPARWALCLCSSYRTTHATPPLMLEAAERFAASGRDVLAELAREKAHEETSHDLLAVRDLAALGYDAEALVEAVVPSSAAALVAYFTEAVHSEDPIGCIGYAYGLERLALCVDTEFIARVQACLPPGVDATRCLRVHSATGADEGHVAELVEVIASLSADERSSVVKACYETAVLCRQPSDFDLLPEQSLRDRLQQFQK